MTDGSILTREHPRGMPLVCRDRDGRSSTVDRPGLRGAVGERIPEPDAEALDGLRLNMRVLHEAAEPDTGMALLGLPLAMPVLAAPCRGGLYPGDEAGLAQAMVFGAADAGIAGCIGDGDDEALHRAGLDAARKVRGRAIPFFFPWRESALLRRIEHAEQAGCAAVGLDAAALDPAAAQGPARTMRPLSPARLRRLIRQTPLPVVVKGVMTPDEARVAVDAGAAAIVVTSGAGAGLGLVPGVAEVLPWIVEAVAGQCAILAQGGVRTGADVLKLLALGANAVAAGALFAGAALDGGREGVAACASRLRMELVQAMILTGTVSARNVSRSVLYVRR